MARLKGFQKLTSIEDALQLFLKELSVEQQRKIGVPTSEALGRVLAEEVIAEEDMPRFDKSAVDGYAVKAKDTVGASQFKPVLLQITDASKVDQKQAEHIWTGNSLPEGSDAVVMLENMKKTDDLIEAWVSLAPGDNVSKKGEDIKKGEVAVKAGTRLKPQHLGLIASLGLAEIQVFEKPRVAILATGNELAEVGKKLGTSEIYETNRIIVSGMCQELGTEPLDLGIVEDDSNEILEKLSLGLKIADVIITTGGTSVGAFDLVPEAVNKAGKPGVIVHGVAMRPAMPTALAVVEGKPVLILSGNPVAAMIGFEVFARPLLCSMLGMKHEEQRPIVEAELTGRVSTALGRRTFVRVRVHHKGGRFLAEPVSARGSGNISTMTRANGYVIAPQNREGLLEGEFVRVHLFDNLESAD